MNTHVLSRAPQQSVSLADQLAKLHIDLWLGLLLLALGVVGLLVQYSASGHSMAVVINQAERLGLGFGVMIIAAQAPPEFYRRSAPWLYGFGVLMLLAVLVLGDHAKGAQRWLDLGVLRFQPSEILKLAMPMAVAAYLHTRRCRRSR